MPKAIWSHAGGAVLSQRDQNREAFADTGLVEVIDLLKKRYGAKVLGAVNDETGYAVGEDLGPREVTE